MTPEKVEAIAKAVAGLKYIEWRRVKEAIDKEFSCATDRLELPAAQELIPAIKMEAL